MRIIFSLFLFFFISEVSISQISAIAGITYGGAIPNKTDTNSKGKPGIGFNAGISYHIKLGEKLSLASELHYYSRSFEYESNVRHDTVVEVEFGGSVTQLPTYYKAKVHGNVYTHHIDLSEMAVYRIGRYFSVTGGWFGSFALAGRDAVHVVVSIGEGGVVDDIVQDENHWTDINRFETGAKLGGIFHINNNFAIRFIGARAVSRFYKKGYINDESGQSISFYYTMLQAGFSYRF